MNKHLLTLIIASATAWASVAQDLVKEIDVDRTIVPAEREVSRPSSPTPTIFTPTVQPVQLYAADRYTPSAITPLVSVTSTATWGGTQTLTPYRGYVAGGYLPIFNLGLTAGYQLISTTESQLGVWAMYNGDNHKYQGEKYKDNFLRLGLGGSHTFSTGATFQGDITYRHDSFTTPFVEDNKQGASILDARLAFLGKCDLVNYNINADVNHLAFADPLSAVLNIDGKAMKQTQLRLAAGALLNINDFKTLRPGVDLAVDYLLSNNRALATASGLTTGNATYGIITASPYVLFRKSDFESRIGLKLSVATSDQSGVHVAPDISFAYRPKQPFAVWATLYGGMGQNRIYDLYERDYTTTPPLAMKSYNIPIALRAGISVGPFSGFRASAHFGFAFVRDMAIPWLNTTVVRGMTTESKLDGLNAGIDLSYTHKYFTLKVGAEASTSSDTNPAKGWYLWRDRAKSALSASLEVRPITPLAVSVSYNGRFGRHTFAPRTNSSEPWQMQSTRDISNLNLAAKYAYTPALTFFIRAENILNHRYFFSSTVPAPGFTGLLGAEYKF